jgi:Domain of unknown function (DUF4129)
MAGSDRSTRSAIAVVALLVLVAVALRGHLPGGDDVADRRRPDSSPLALVVDIALLAAAVAIIGYAVIVRLRDRRVRPSARGPLPGRSGAVTGRPTWRFSLIALALIIGWLVLVMLLTRVGALGPVDPPASVPAAPPDETAAPPTGDGPQPPPPPDDGGADVLGYLVPPMVILMAMIVAATVIASRLQRRGTTPHPVDADGAEVPASAAATESLARAAELGLAEIGDLSREPREAIIACYAAMERELTRVPGAVPQDCDTPTEVLARAVAHHALHADSATRLVELFEEARFSPHVMTEAHRDMAVEVLRLVLADLRSVA